MWKKFTLCISVCYEIHTHTQLTGSNDMVIGLLFFVVVVIIIIVVLFKSLIRPPTLRNDIPYVWSITRLKKHYTTSNTYYVGARVGYCCCCSNYTTTVTIYLIFFIPRYIYHTYILYYLSCLGVWEVPTIIPWLFIFEPQVYYRLFFELFLYNT